METRPPSSLFLLIFISFPGLAVTHEDVGLYVYVDDDEYVDPSTRFLWSLAQGGVDENVNADDDVDEDEVC